MKTCSNCHHDLKEGAKFCEHCGHPVKTTTFCPKCGVENDIDAHQCVACAFILKEPQATSKKTKTHKEKARTKPKKVKTKKETEEVAPKSNPIIKITILMVLVFALGLGVLTLFNKKAGQAIEGHLLYLKDNEIVYTDFKTKTPFQVSENLDPNQDGFLQEIMYYLSSFIDLTPDDKNIIYPDYLDQYSDFKLYKRMLNKPKQSPTQIANVQGYYITNEAKNIITHYNYDDEMLYQIYLDQNETVELASYLSYYQVSNDGKTVYVQTDSNDIYLIPYGKEKIKLASEARIEYIPTDFSKVYYTQDDILYKHDGKKETQIATDVERILQTYESGELYYLKQSTHSINLLEYIIDEYEESDASVEVIEAPEQPYWFEFEDDDAYDKALKEYEALYEIYLENADQYTQIEHRNMIRDSLKDQELNYNTYSLYYYDGQTERLINDDFYDSYEELTYNINTYTPMIAYSAYNREEYEPIFIDEIEYIYQVEAMVMEAISSNRISYFANKNDEMKAPFDNYHHLLYAPDHKTIYFAYEDEDDEFYLDLYSLSVLGTSLSQESLYDTDVLFYTIQVYDDNQMVYFKEGGSNDDLYLSKTRVEQDLGYFSESVMYSEKTKYLYYKVNDSLKVYHQNTSTLLADEVAMYHELSDGSLVYLSQYDTENEGYHLYHYVNNKTTLIDEAVQHIIQLK